MIYSTFCLDGNQLLEANLKFQHSLVVEEFVVCNLFLKLSPQSDGSMIMENGVVQVHLDTLGRVTSLFLMQSKR